MELLPILFDTVSDLEVAKKWELEGLNVLLSWKNDANWQIWDCCNTLLPPGCKHTIQWGRQEWMMLTYRCMYASTCNLAGSFYLLYIIKIRNEFFTVKLRLINLASGAGWENKRAGSDDILTAAASNCSHRGSSAIVFAPSPVSKSPGLSWWVIVLKNQQSKTDIFFKGCESELWISCVICNPTQMLMRICF